MFESITISNYNQDKGVPVFDLAFLMECLLFYKKVHLIVGESILKKLITQLGSDLLLTLLEDGVLSVHYEYDHLATQTSSQGKFKVHCPISFNSPNHTLVRVVNRLNFEDGVKGVQRMKLISRLLSKIKVFSRELAVIDAANERLSDKDFVSQAAKVSMASLFPNYTKDIKFECIKIDTGFVVETDVPFGFLNSIAKAYGNTEISEAHILDGIWKVESNLSIAASHLSEIATSPLAMELVRLRYSHLIRRFELSESAKINFTELVIGDAKSIRTAIERNEPSLGEIVDLILKASKFKDWLSQQKPSSDLVCEYYKEITSSSIFDRLPGKSIRWGVCAGFGVLADLTFAGGIGTLMGNAIGAVDAFYLDRFLKGWKPNHFVEDQFKKTFKL